MARIRYIAAALVVAAGIGAGAAWAASGGTTTSPNSTTPSTTTGSNTTPTRPGTHHCPGMGSGSNTSQTPGMSGSNL